jgi:hypothetical protein
VSKPFILDQGHDQPVYTEELVEEFRRDPEKVMREFDQETEERLRQLLDILEQDDRKQQAA